MGMDKTIKWCGVKGVGYVMPYTLNPTPFLLYFKNHH